MLLIRLFTVIFFFSTAQHALSQTLFSYDFNGATGSQSSTAATLGSGVSNALSVSAITRGPGITGNAGANSFNSTGFVVSGTAIDLTEYQSIVINPSNGVMNLTSLQFRTQRSGTGPPNVELHYSLDTFASSNVTIGSFTLNNTSAAVNVFDVSTINALQNLSQTVEFRLYEFGGSNAAGTFRITNNGASSAISDQGIVVIGTFTPVPEPTTILGITAVSVGLIGGLRRRFKK